MVDIKTQIERSKNMKAIKSKDTKSEVYLRRELYSRGYRYRKNFPHITGCPDIYMQKYRTAIFVNGCFWHRHTGCKYAYNPKSRTEFWTKKFSDNVIRDKNTKIILEEQNIKCFIIWECTIKSMMKNSDYNEKILEQLLDFFNSDNLFMEV